MTYDKAKAPSLHHKRMKRERKREREGGFSKSPNH